MSFKYFYSCVNSKLNRDIKSRRLKMKVTIQEFSVLSKKYFKKLNLIDDNFEFIVNNNEKINILFVLRVFFKLWVEENKDLIRIYKNFPKKFILIKEVNKSNHFFTPKTFPKGSIMYSVKPAYSSVNQMNGTPLWDNLETIKDTKLIPSVQIKYDFIKPIR